MLPLPETNYEVEEPEEEREIASFFISDENLAGYMAEGVGLDSQPKMPFSCPFSCSIC